VIRTVAKHRYFKGKAAALSVRQYIGYVAFRGGPDARASGRKFFDQDSDSISFAKVKAEFAYNPVPGQSVLTHELILSPGVQSVDAQRYTRVLMDKLERSMGRNLKWAAVAHKGKHNHIHVFIDGRDKNERRVYLRKEEYRRLREWGDKYIQNEHGLERYLRKEVDLDEPFEREKGDALYETLFENGEQKQELQEPQSASTSKIFGAWDKSKAVAELADENKIYFRGKAFHQFNSTKELYGLLKRSGDKLSDDQVVMVKQWIIDKESFGDDHHERLERESIVRKKRRHRIPRKNKKPENKQDNKESEIARGKKNLNAPGLGKEISTINPFTVQEEIAEEDVDRDIQKLFVSDEDELESRIQLSRVVKNRPA